MKKKQACLKFKGLKYNKRVVMRITHCNMQTPDRIWAYFEQCRTKELQKKTQIGRLRVSKSFS